MTTLYRKYRPQSFNEIVGQNHIKTILTHEVEASKIAHAYLFCGPRAVGKTTMARLLAKAINCEKRAEGKFEPCSKCAACQSIVAGRSLDVLEIDAASNTGVDNVRENIIASARVAPNQLKYKVFIIDEVHMLSPSAFNALLKILEEPPQFVVFVLCTTEIHKVPATIISRCQRFDFRRISVSDITKKLAHIVSKEGVKIDKEILEAIARHSGGHMRDAESLLGQVVNVGGKEISREEADLVIPRSDLGEVVNLIDLLSKKDAAGGIRLVNRLLDEGLDLKVFLTDLLEVLRKMLLIKINPSLAQNVGAELGESLELKVSELGKVFAVEQLAYVLEQFSKAILEIKNSFILQMPVELAIVRLCSAAGVARTAAAGPVNARPVAAPRPVTEQLKGPGEVSFSEILEKWNELLIKVKKYNHSLSFILRVCQPRSLNGNAVCLAFKYKFHKDRLNDPVIRGSMEKVLKEVYNTPLTVEAVIDETLAIDENGNGNGNGNGHPPIIEKEVPVGDGAPAGGENKMIDKLLKTFGGKVVG
jgi:DNA polymerase-3 subunit gamma/tau